jgi:hypothetical protein
MITNKITDKPNPLQCTKCEKIFSTSAAKENHDIRKIPCDSKLKCNKCGKEFKRRDALARHIGRKTSCAPIKGDPTVKAVTNQCIYCRKKYASKFNLKRHSIKCEIKNGGMELLFKEVARMKKRLGELEVEKNDELDVKSVLKNEHKYAGVVYFIRVKKSSHFKIGYTTKKAKSRLSALQTGCPYDLELFMCVGYDEPKSLEKHLHDCFAEKLMRGEWYNIKEEEVESIAVFLNSKSV